MSDVIAWLSAPGAQIFVRALENKIALMQVKSGNVLEECITYPGKKVEIDEILDQMRVIHNCLSVLRASKEKAGDLAFINISVG